MRPRNSHLHRTLRGQCTLGVFEPIDIERYRHEIILQISTVPKRIQPNEDTIWNGKKRNRVNPEALKALPEVRRLKMAIMAGRAIPCTQQDWVWTLHLEPRKEYMIAF